MFLDVLLCAEPGRSCWVGKLTAPSFRGVCPLLAQYCVASFKFSTYLAHLPPPSRKYPLHRPLYTPRYIKRTKWRAETPGEGRPRPRTLPYAPRAAPISLTSSRGAGKYSPLAPHPRPASSSSTGAAGTAAGLANWATCSPLLSTPSACRRLTYRATGCLEIRCPATGVENGSLDQGPNFACREYQTRVDLTPCVCLSNGCFLDPVRAWRLVYHFMAFQPLAYMGDFHQSNAWRTFALAGGIVAARSGIGPAE